MSGGDRHERACWGKIGDADWQRLRLCVALVCNEGFADWDALAASLHELGRRPDMLSGESSLALTVLADFADRSVACYVVETAQSLTAKSSESQLRAITEAAAGVVDRAYPGQAFSFRATLVLLSMFASARASIGPGASP